VALALLAYRAFSAVNPSRPWSAAMVLIGATFAVIGISYPWYALLLVPLVALDGRARWLAIAAAAYPAYLAPSLGISLSTMTGIAYAAALVLIALVTRVERRRGAREADRVPVPTG
jgi:hypothetical protein